MIKENSHGGALKCATRVAEWFDPQNHRLLPMGNLGHWSGKRFRPFLGSYYCLDAHGGDFLSLKCLGVAY
jgi:hypothetical protein